MKLKKFFGHFPNPPWALRVSGMGGYTSKCEQSQCSARDWERLGLLGGIPRVVVQISALTLKGPL